MEDQITEFQYFINIFWPFFVGSVAVCFICGFVGSLMFWLNLSMGDK